MAVKNYGIHDKWTDLDKLNNVDIKSVDGVIESVKINGEEAGGGGSSDFSTAEVTFINSAEGKSYSLLAKAFVRVADDETIGENSEVYVSGQETFKIVIYKGSQFIPLTKFLHFDAQTMPIITGDIEFVTSPAYGFIVTGDGTITAKGTESAS